MGKFIREFEIWGVRVAPLLAFLILIGATVYGFYQDEQRDQVVKTASEEARRAIVISGRTATTVGCNRDYRSIERARVGFREDFQESIEQLALFVKDGTITEEQAVRARKSGKERLRSHLKGTQLPDCRQAQNAITDDPSRTGTIPEPLFPGHSKD